MCICAQSYGPIIPSTGSGPRAAGGAEPNPKNNAREQPPSYGALHSGSTQIVVWPINYVKGNGGVTSSGNGFSQAASARKQLKKNPCLEKARTFEGLSQLLSNIA